MRVDMMILEQNKYMLPGYVVLKRNGEVVWYGPLSAPCEDVDCDTAILSPVDFAKVAAVILGKKRE